MKRITISLTEEMYEELRLKAFNMHLSLSACIAKLLTDGFPRVPSEKVVQPPEKVEKVRGELKGEDYL